MTLNRAHDDKEVKEAMKLTFKTPILSVMWYTNLRWEVSFRTLLVSTARVLVDNAQIAVNVMDG
jgi:hypothetical protein